MDNNPGKKYFTPKFLLLGFLFVIIVGGIFIFLGASQKNPLAPKTPSPENQQITPFPTTAPDKQIEGQIVVKFKPQYTNTQISEHLKQYNASIVKKIEGINYTVVKVPAGQENAILEKLKNDPYVQSALPDYTNHATYIPNDPNFALQYGLNNTGQSVRNVTGTAKADINAEAAWDVSKGSGVKVAILDSGIDQTHPELASKIAVTKVFASSAIDPDLRDRNGHGTHVAGIIAASTNNGQGIAGTCPNCQLIIGKVVNNDANGNATGSTSDIVSGMTWAADQGAKVINLSLRTTTSGSAPLYQQGIDYANSKGAVVVVAAGNDGSNAQVWPAANSGVVSVAATDNNDKMASFSNFGTFVKVAAPGVNIYSTLPTTTNAKGVLSYGYLSGTSMASPMVAGVIGLIWASPYGTSNTAVINRLYATADKIAGTGTDWTEGRINAGNAVGALPTATPTLPGGGVPSPQCVGGVGAPPCATIAPTAGTTIIPPVSGRLSQSPSAGVSQPATSGQPLSPAPSSGTPGGTPSTPCPQVSSLVFNNASEVSDYGDHRRKFRRKRFSGGNNGFFSQIFQWLLQLIERLFQLIGIGNPCLIQPPVGAPNPGLTPGAGGPIASPNPLVSNAPGTSVAPVVPGTSLAPGTSAAPVPGTSTAPVTSNSPAPGVSTVPPANGGGGGNPNTPNPQAKGGVCNLSDIGNGWSYCVGDGPNSYKCLPPGGSCGAPTTPLGDGPNKGAYCVEPQKQEYIPPAPGAARGVCRVCPAGASVKTMNGTCACDQTGQVISSDRTTCIQQIQGCSQMDTTGGKCSQCASALQQPSSDGKSCVDKPKPPVVVPPPANGGGGTTCNPACTSGYTCTSGKCVANTPGSNSCAQQNGYCANHDDPNQQYTCSNNYGTWKTGLCPGAANMQCCVKGTSPGGSGGGTQPSNSCAQQNGYCANHDDPNQQYTCSNNYGTWKTGLCPGAANMQCCVKGTSPGGSGGAQPAQTCAQQNGYCANHDDPNQQYACSNNYGTWKTGLCPGAANMQCCVKGTSAK